MRRFLINGTEVLFEKTWSITQKLYSRTTFSGRMIMPQNFIPALDMVIDINNNADLIFRGIITTCTPSDDGTLVSFDITATDYSALADKRIISAVDYNISAGDFIRTQIMPILAEEGVTAGVIYDGAIIKKAAFPFRSVSACLDTLCDVSGDYYWRITNDKKLDFLPMSQSHSTTTIDDAFPAKSLKYSASSADYRNTQILIGSYTQTAPQRETPIGVKDSADLTKMLFTLRFPVAMEPAIYVDGVRQTDIGVAGIQDNAQWVWSYNSKTITRNNCAWTTTPTVLIVYRGLYTIINKQRSQAEINRKKALLPNTSGIYETLSTDQNITETDQAAQYCKALLDKYAKASEKITFSAQTAAFNVGQLIAVDRKRLGVSGKYLCTNVKISRANADMINYDVTLAGGNSVGGWDAFFRALVDKSKNVVIGDGETVQGIHLVSEGMSMAGMYGVTVLGRLWPSESLWPNDAQYPNTIAGGESIND